MAGYRIRILIKSEGLLFRGDHDNLSLSTSVSRVHVTRIVVMVVRWASRNSASVFLHVSSVTATAQSSGCYKTVAVTLLFFILYSSKIHDHLVSAPFTKAILFKMAFTPVFPEQHTRRPISQGSRTFRSKFHPLLSTGVQSLIRSQFSIGEWILIGCALQAIIILISPFPVVYALTPTVALALCKVAHTIMITYGLVDNHHMKNVRVGRHSAVFPEEDGSFARHPGDTVGGSGMVVFILSTKCNQ